MTSNRCWKRIEYLQDRIEERQTLKEAQVRNSTHYRFFQREINDLTNELRAWETNISSILELDAQIADITNQVNAQEWEASHIADNWSQATKGCGLIGMLLVVISLAWSPSLILLGTGVVLLMLAWRARYLWTRAYSSALQAEIAARGRLAQLHTQRDKLIPRA